MDLSSLVHELLFEIVGHLDKQRDISSLARTSKYFHALFNDHLYRHNIKYDRYSALFWALSNGRESTVQKVFDLDPFIDVNTTRTGRGPAGDFEGWFLMHSAVSSGQIKFVQQLLVMGANPDADTGYCHKPLCYAMFYKREDIARLLINHSNDLSRWIMHTRRVTFSPLHLASYQGLTGIVRLLLNKGQDVNIRDRNGSTPLRPCPMRASSQYQSKWNGTAAPRSFARAILSPDDILETMEILLELGADLDLRTQFGIRWDSWCFQLIRWDKNI